MENIPTSPALKTYRVWADHVVPVFQEIQAESPEQAYEIAEKQPEQWEALDAADDDYRLSNAVQDANTAGSFTVGPVAYCPACGSEIVATIKDGYFRDGECGPCEYERYTSQPGLLAALEETRRYLDSTSAIAGKPSQSLRSVLRLIDTAIATAHGAQS